jgi:hypothetical protein
MRSSSHLSHLSSTSIFAILGLIGPVSGCDDPETKDPNIGQCTPLPGETCESETGDETGDGDDEVEEGGDSDGGPVALASDECQHNYDEGKIGIQYQCMGELHTTLEFAIGANDCTDVLGAAWCVQEFVFGNGFQPYAAAEVVACCGEFNYEYLDTYNQFCVYDMYQQLCSTLSERMEAAINNGDFGAFTNAAVDVQVWIADHYAECFDALLMNNSGTSSDPVTHWELGTFGALENVVLRIDMGSEAYGVNLPVDEGEWLSCHGANGDDEQIFEDAHTPNGGIVVGVDLDADVDADLLGPSVLGGIVTASAAFDAGCLARGCSAAQFSYNTTGAQFTMEEFDIFTETPFVVTNGTYALTVTRAQIRLWTQAVGYKVIDSVTGQLLGYEIPAGAAQFVVAGVTDGPSNRFMTVNSTDIWIVANTGGSWDIDTFDLQFEDGNSSQWTITLDASHWD